MDKRILAMVLAAACASEPAPKLLGGADGDDVPIDQTPEAQERRARMNLTLDVGGKDQPFTVRFFAATAVVGECLKMLRDDPGGMPFADATGNGIAGCAVPWDIVLPDGDTALPPSFTALPTDGTTACEVAMCRAQVGLCVANKLMELSTSVAPTEFKGAVLGMPITTLKAVLPAPVPVDITLAPAVEEQAVAYTEEAFHYSAWVATIAGENLRKAAYSALADKIIAKNPDNAEAKAEADALRLIAPTGACTLAQIGPPKTDLFPLHVGNTKMGQRNFLYGEAFAASLSEASVMAEEAARAAVKHHVAVADADFSRYVDIGKAAHFAWISPDISRSRAAHLLVGGDLDAGLMGLTRGIGAVEELTDREKLARDILRLAAPHPGPTFDPKVDLETLFSVGAPVAGGKADVPVRERLAQRLANPSVRSMSSAQFLESRDLTEHDFQRAREVMAHDADAFLTDRTQLLPAQQIPSVRDPSSGALVPQTSNFPLYGATGMRPVAPSTVEYRERLLFSKHKGADTHDSRALTLDDVIRPDSKYARKSASKLRDYSISTASEVLGVIANSSWSQYEAFLEALAKHVGAQGGRQTGRLESCHRYWAGADEVRIRAYGYSVPEELDVVVGAEGLRCATSPTATGCKLEDHRLPLASVGSITKEAKKAAHGAAGYRDYVEIIVKLGYHQASAPWLFLVRRPKNHLAVAGAYEGLGSVPIELASTPTLSWSYCTLTPIQKDIDALIGEIMTPSIEEAGRAVMSCSGAYDIEQIPLQAELSRPTSGDKYESSWRGFLQSAKEKAANADHLGEQLVANGLEMDVRTETAEAKLGDLCGGAVNLSTRLETVQPPLTQCSVDMKDGDACNAEGGVCRNGTCVTDVMERVKTASDTMSAKLSSCIGDESVVPFVTLGSEPKCLWSFAKGKVCDVPEGTRIPENAQKNPLWCMSDPRDLPAGETCATGDTSCDQVSRKKCDQSPIQPAATTTSGPARIYFVQPLGIFKQADADYSNGHDDEPPCTALRKLRNLSLPYEERLKLVDGPANAIGGIAPVNNGFFAPSNLVRWARRIGWEAGVDDYSTVTVDGVPFASTGNAFSPPIANVWPCGVTNEQRQDAVEGECRTPTYDGTDYPELADSLMCSRTYNLACADPLFRDRRAIMNDRLGQAVVTLRLLTGAGLQDLTIPYVQAGSTGAVQQDVGSWRNWPISAPNGWSHAPVEFHDGRNVGLADKIRFVWDYHGYTAPCEGCGNPDPGPIRFPQVEIDGHAYCLDGVSTNVDQARDYSEVEYHHTAWTNVALGWLAKPGYSSWSPSFHHRSFLPCMPTDSGSWGWQVGSASQPVERFVIFRTLDEASPVSGAGLFFASLWDGLDHSSSRMTNQNGYLRSFLLLRPSSWPDRELPDLLDRVNEWTLRVPGESGNRISIRDLTQRSVFDAMELACEVARKDPGSGATCGVEPPVVRSIADLPAVEDFLRCLGNQTKHRAGLSVLADVPRVTVQAMRQSPKFEGQLGAAAGELAAAIVAQRELQRNIDAVSKDFSFDMQRVRLQMEASNLSAEIIHVQQLQSIANSQVSCTMANLQAEAALTSLAGGVVTSLGAVVPSLADAVVTSLAGGVVTAAFNPADLLAPAGTAISGMATAMIEHEKADTICTNAAAEQASIIKQAALQGALIDVKNREIWIDMAEKISGHAETLARGADELHKQGTLIRAALARLETIRNEGHRSLANIVLAGSDSAGRNYAVNTVMRRRFNTVQIRYENERQRAIKAAWVARRAIEQKIGKSLSSIEQDLHYVEAPARWVDKLCTTTGIDYSRLRSETGLQTDHYADGYIGDYVNKLEDVVDSYPHDFPYTDGADTAVVSLKDDVAEARTSCKISVNNLLANSAVLDQGSRLESSGSGEGAVPTPAMPGWDRVHCEPLSTGEINNCLSVFRLPDMANPHNRPIVRTSVDTGGAPGYRITFAPTWDGVAETSFRPATALVQTVQLEPGTYRLSWYGRAMPGVEPPTLLPENAVAIRRADGAVFGGELSPTGSTPGESGGWPRHHRIFRVTESGNYQIAIVPSGVAGQHGVDLGGLMLENLGTGLDGRRLEALSPASHPPRSYTATSAASVAWSDFCEDTSGEGFRRLWKRGCEAEDPSLHCYWEYSFALPLDAILSGRALAHAGFAYGNYNHRIDSIAVNFVGTGLRDCSTSTTPSSCNASGYLSYSLEHGGPYEVLNHWGDTYEAPLFTTYIKHADGLASERYLTNPLSSADRGLIAPFGQEQLRGRPITGTYAFRVWDDENVAFEALEDVQILFNYRYWTQQGR